MVTSAEEGSPGNGPRNQYVICLSVVLRERDVVFVVLFGNRCLQRVDFVGLLLSVEEDCDLGVGWVLREAVWFGVRDGRSYGVEPPASFVPQLDRG